MIGSVRSKLQKLRALPRDLFASIGEVRTAVERQQATLDEEIRALNDQLPELADTLLKLLIQLRTQAQQRDQAQRDQDQFDEGRRTIAAPPAALPVCAAGGTVPSCIADRLAGRRERDLSEMAEVVHSGIVTALAAPDTAVSRQLQEILLLQRDSHWILPSHLGIPEVAERVRHVLSVLRPFRLGNAVKTRLGRANDGGYVVIDDFDTVDCALSLGIDSNVSWDLAVAQRGIRVLQYDHTISGPPETHALFEFHRTRIACDGSDGTRSIEALLRDRKAAGDQRIVLKIDIEGDEWQCLADADPALLELCPQIVCEFHHLHRLAEPEFAELAYRCFTKLCTGFFVCHVHANNCGNVYNLGNVMVPDTLEITFANRTHYQPVDSLEIFPTPIDMPNQPGRADIFLGAFRFAA
jgi:hypothetical protein